MPNSAHDRLDMLSSGIIFRGSSLDATMPQTFIAISIYWSRK